ncbi:MAG: LysR family transcriptional regulator [Burkholderiaceae bacterium]
MELRHVRTFVTVAELGTVSSAALHLHTAQPALSRQISDLERELSIKLFDRVGRRLVLTSEGEQLLSDCRGLLNWASAIGERAQLLRHGDSGTLKVTASPHLIEGIFADFLHRYGQRYPNVQVKLVDVVGPDMLTMLERGELHLAQSLVRAIPPDDHRFESYPLEAVDMLAACQAGQKLGKCGQIEIAELAPYPLLQISSEFVIRKTFDAACRLAGITPNILTESRAPHALLALAEAGHGVAIIPSALRTQHYRLRIVRVTYQGKPLSEPLTILSDRRRPLPPYAMAFREMLGEHCRNVFPITRPTEDDPDSASQQPYKH